VHAIQVRQGILIACLEEIALGNGWITREDVLRASGTWRNNDYGLYLAEIARGP
jgi:glucose-1-phosphate thymidylyltransferase